MPLTLSTFEDQFSQFIKTEKRFPEKTKHPCLSDIDSGHDYCDLYLRHIAWASRLLMRTRPTEHHDFGSFMYWVACASAICPITFYDIRSADIAIPGIKIAKADLTNIPLPSGSLYSVSSLHATEHVGLARYGDNLDPEGDLKAARELIRVLAPGGQLLMVLPVGRPRLVFNAHRIYSYEMVMDMFSDLKLLEFTLCTGEEYIENADPRRVPDIPNEGAGCFWFVKE